MLPGTEPTEDPKEVYSKAFETFVENGDDLVGLIAYALYKQSVREAAQRKGPIKSSAHREPTQTEIETYKGNAERRLQKFAAAATAQAEPEIVARGVAVSIEAVRVDLAELIRERTSTRSAIVTNLVAWVITLALTVLVIAAIYLPNWQGDLVDRLRAPPPVATTPH